MDGVRKNVDSRSLTAVLSGRHFRDEEVGEKKINGLPLDEGSR